jgi:hypothetical protein
LPPDRIPNAENLITNLIAVAGRPQAVRAPVAGSFQP